MMNVFVAVRGEISYSYCGTDEAAIDAGDPHEVGGETDKFSFIAINAAEFDIGAGAIVFTKHCAFLVEDSDDPLTITGEFA